ncbi:MAG: EF-Tu/IF-2/RF-3 family GTPase [Pseudomonadota bacterium]|jgi:putative protease
MAEDLVGVVTNFYARPGVAGIKITSGSIRKGDILRYKGHTTDFTEEVASIEIENTPVDEAKTGDLAGVKVRERVRENDKVYKVVNET